MLLVTPLLALSYLAQHVAPRLLLGYLGIIFALTFFYYWHDKRRAQNGGWRTPESTLHLLEIGGGWPAAYLAQRCLRHKISKKRYQWIFWSIVILHEGIAFDFIQDWANSRRLLAWLFG